MERETMEQYLRRSRRMQRRVRWLSIAGAVIPLALILGDAPGMFAFLAGAVTAIFAVSGLWITQGHIQDFEQALRARRM